MTARRNVLAALITGAVTLAGAAVPAHAAASPLTVPESAITELKKLVEDNATDFGGLAQYPDTKTLVVTLPKKGADPVAAKTRVSELTERVEARALTAEATWRVEYRTVERSLHDLTAIKDGVPTRQPFAGVASERLSGWQVDHRTNTVSIGVTKVDQDIIDVARSTYGESVTLYEQERPSRTSRLDDVSPWSAGLRINGPEICTGGFTISHQGVEYMLTAGHCGPVGSNWYNGTSGGGNHIGHTDLGFYGRFGYDSAIIRGANYDPSMYIGGVHSTVYRSVTGTYAPPIGAAICVSGSISGASCASVVIDHDVCRTFSDNITTCHMTEAEFTDTRIVNGGDSGGPVYANFGGNVRATGQVIGSNPTHHYYHPIDDLLALYGAVLVTAG